MKLSVREIQETDFDQIADYWLTSETDHLISMGVDLEKLPTRKTLHAMLEQQIEAAYDVKASFALIWEIDGIACGHCNVNDITFGDEAYMHLHMWQSENRNKGMGSEFVMRSMITFFDKLHLKKLISEPYAHNVAPNRTLEKLGFKKIKTYTCMPGSLNFEQEVTRWEFFKRDLESIMEIKKLNEA